MEKQALSQKERKKKKKKKKIINARVNQLKPKVLDTLPSTMASFESYRAAELGHHLLPTAISLYT